MRLIVAVVLVVGCAPLPGSLAPLDAAAFNACDPGSPDPTGQCGGGGGGSPTCNRPCSSNVECGGAAQLCRYCNFGECKSTAPGSPVVDAGAQ